VATCRPGDGVVVPGVHTYPQDDGERSGAGKHDEQEAEQHRCGPARDQQPSARNHAPEANRRGDLRDAGHDRPRSDEVEEYDSGNAGRGQRQHAERDAEDATDQQPRPRRLTTPVRDGCGW